MWYNSVLAVMNLQVPSNVCVALLATIYIQKTDVVQKLRYECQVFNVRIQPKLCCLFLRHS